MATNIEIRYDDNILICKVSGSHTSVSPFTDFNKILDFAAKHETHNILIDTTRITDLQKSSLEAYEYGKFIIAKFDENLLTNKRFLNLAFVCNHEIQSDIHIVELITRKRGVNTKVFTKMRLALQWIKNQ